MEAVSEFTAISPADMVSRSRRLLEASGDGAPAEAQGLLSILIREVEEPPDEFGQRR